MFRLKIFFLYIRYLFISKTKHGVHSPFIFKLITEALEKNIKNCSGLEKIENIRKALLNNNSILYVEDLGAGSRKNKGSKRSLRQIAQSAPKNKKYSRLMYNLVSHFKPATILELGTSLGITASCMSFAYPASTIISIEGSDAIAGIARKNLEELGISNVEVVTGSFNEQLEQCLQRLGKIDFVFFDGDHREESTLGYFSRCIPYTNNDTVFVFDDIRWSPGMMRAWEKIKKHDRVNCTVDLFFMGIVFMRKEQAKEHFIIRY